MQTRTLAVVEVEHIEMGAEGTLTRAMVNLPGRDDYDGSGLAYIEQGIPDGETCFQWEAGFAAWMKDGDTLASLSETEFVEGGGRTLLDEIREDFDPDREHIPELYGKRLATLAKELGLDD